MSDLGSCVPPFDCDYSTAKRKAVNDVTAYIFGRFLII